MTEPVSRRRAAPLPAEKRRMLGPRVGLKPDRPLPPSRKVAPNRNVDSKKRAPTPKRVFGNQGPNFGLGAPIGSRLEGGGDRYIPIGEKPVLAGPSQPKGRRPAPEPVAPRSGVRRSLQPVGAPRAVASPRGAGIAESKRRKSEPPAPRRTLASTRLQAERVTNGVHERAMRGGRPFELPGRVKPVGKRSGRKRRVAPPAGPPGIKRR